MSNVELHLYFVLSATMNSDHCNSILNQGKENWSYFPGECTDLPDGGRTGSVSSGKASFTQPIYLKRGMMITSLYMNTPTV